MQWKLASTYSTLPKLDRYLLQRQSKTELEKKQSQPHYISAIIVSNDSARHIKTSFHAMPNKETKLRKINTNSVCSVCWFTPWNFFAPQLPPPPQLLLLQPQLPYPLPPPLDWQTKHTLTHTWPHHWTLFKISLYLKPTCHVSLQEIL
jgi:hypothetical protein